MKKMFKPLLALLLTVPLVLSAQAAFAATAANTEIKNTATLSYTGGSKDATSIVTVSLVAMTPTILLNGNNAGYLLADSPELGNSLLLTSNANGPATYAVTAIVGSSGGQVQVNNGSPATGSVLDGGGFNVILGASVTTASATHTSTANTLVIPKPNTANISGVAGTYIVNGLTYGDTVKYGVSTANIKLYADDPNAIVVNADGTVTLTLDASAGVAPIGTLVQEQKTVSGISSKPGTIVTLGTNIDVYSQATVTTAGAAAATSNWAKTYWTSSLASTELNKYVRNLTAAGNPAAGSACDLAGTNFTVNTSNNRFYPSSCVTGNNAVPDILEYVVLAKNTSLVTDLAAAVISDVLPTAYVTFNFGAYGGKDVFYSADGSGAGTTTFTAAGAGANQASFSPWPFPAPVPPSVTLSVNVGSGATAAIPSIGVIAKEAVAGTPTALFIAYQVIIK